LQVIYIDILIFTNIFQDFILLLITKRALHLKTTYFRLTAGSVAGGLFSLIALLPPLNFLINLIIKIAIASILIIITFGFHGVKQFIRNTTTLFMVTFLFNGALICFYLAIKPKGMAIVNNTAYFNISPSLLIILTFAVYFILRIYRKLFKNYASKFEVVNVKINQKYIIKCKIDSGCNVKEPFSGNYVIIVEESQITDIIPDNSKMRVIPFESLGGDGFIYGFKANEVEIQNKIISQEIYIGICNNIFKNDFKGLIPENLIKDWLYEEIIWTF